MTIEEKQENLHRILREAGSASIAFSGGVDSTYLLKEAHEVLQDKMIAYTAESPFFPSWENEEAIAFCRKEGIPQKLIRFDILSIDGVAGNPPDRCYLCKHALFSALKKQAEADGFSCVMEGTNLDDLGDYRPGLKALAELGIRSPLKEAGLHKQEIRELSEQQHLPTWNKPSFACLASRISYGEGITEEKLHRVEAGETFLLQKGFTQVRVRVHGSLARIEVLPEELDRFQDAALRKETSEVLKKAGFSYISLDLEGFRSGSMNRVLKIPD
ncbi:MAG: ATP-dependent sacrificial sulfur transferase LarE [Bulleidia sp.]